MLVAMLGRTDRHESDTTLPPSEKQAGLGARRPLNGGALVVSVAVISHVPSSGGGNLHVIGRENGGKISTKS